MIKRPGLSLKILLVAFLNLTLLLAVFLLMARVQFRLDLGSFLLTPARYRMLYISRVAAFELYNLPVDKWPDLLKQYSSTYPAKFFLFDRDGKQLAGDPVHPPESIFRDRGDRSDFERNHRGPERREGNWHPPPPLAPGPPGDRREPPFPIDFAHTTEPSFYWAAMHVPLAGDHGRVRMDGRLVWRFESLWTNSFFFDYKPWLTALLVVVVVSVGCWLPLIRSITRTVLDVTAATGRIAEGHFEVTLPVKRRDELGQLSESINQMAHRLSGYVNGQRRFLSDIAHELCAPVARIQFSLGILEQRAGESERRYVDTIDEEVQHMSSLVNELLSFSKATLGASAAIENINIAQTVQRAIERETTDNVSIAAHIPPALGVMAQPDYLLRSISNVLRNAVRYAGSDGPIEVSAKRADSMAQIVITDHGPGVPAGELEDILKPFYRPESARQRETGGVGLGLAIVRSCMEACGGTVTCRNRSPRGFEVELRLPLAPSESS